jgi:hypothetical protein
MLSHTRLLVGSTLAAAAFAATAATVDVSFVNAGHYWDAGTSSWDEDANLKELSSHMKKLGQRWLAADQVLKVEVLQLDLAGTVRSFVREGASVRVITGGADWPRIHIRYSLESGGKTLARGEDWVADQDYTHGLAPRGDNEPLFYEKRMLTSWFRMRFVDALAAPG